MRDNEGLGLLIVISTVVLINFIRSLLSFFQWTNLKIQQWKTTKAEKPDPSKLRKYLKNERKEAIEEPTAFQSINNISVIEYEHFYSSDNIPKKTEVDPRHQFTN